MIKVGSIKAKLCDKWDIEFNQLKMISISIRILLLKKGFFSLD